MTLTETVKFSVDFKTYLDKKKIHPRESYEGCIKRLMGYKENKK